MHRSHAYSSNLLQPNLLVELSFVILTTHLCNGLNDNNLVKPRKTCILDTLEVHSNWRNLPVNNGTIFSRVFTDQKFTPILNKSQLQSCDENTMWWWSTFLTQLQKWMIMIRSAREWLQLRDSMAPITEICRMIESTLSSLGHFRNQNLSAFISSPVFLVYLFYELI